MLRAIPPANRYGTTRRFSSIGTTARRTSFPAKVSTPDPEIQRARLWMQKALSAKAIYWTEQIQEIVREFGTEAIRGCLKELATSLKIDLKETGDG